MQCHNGILAVELFTQKRLKTIVFITLLKVLKFLIQLWKQTLILLFRRHLQQRTRIFIALYYTLVIREFILQRARFLQNLLALLRIVPKIRFRSHQIILRNLVPQFSGVKGTHPILQQRPCIFQALICTRQIQAKISPFPVVIFWFPRTCLYISFRCRMGTDHSGLP